MKLGFKGKLLCMIATSLAVAVLLVTSVGYFTARQGLRSQVEDQLSSEGTHVKQNVEAHVKRLGNYALQVNDSRLIEGMFIAYEGALYGAGLVPGKDLDGYTSDFESLNKKFLPRIEKMASDFNLDDIILASTNGQVVFSIAKAKESSVYLGKNLQQGVFKDAALGKCYAKALNAKDRSLVFSGLAINPASGEEEAFLCQGKMSEFDYAADGVKKGDVMGVTIMRISLRDLGELASWKFGAGETGLSYIVGADHLLRTNYHNKINNISSLESLKTNKVFQTPVILSALAGKSGIEIAKNPFNREVLSFFVPVEFFGEAWGLVIEKETEEVFSSVRSMVLRLIAVGLSAFAFVLIGSFAYLNKNISALLLVGERMDQSCLLVSKNGEHLKESSDEMSKGAMSGATSLEQTVASLTQVSSMVDNNSKNASEAYRISVENLESAKAGSEKISRLIESMRTVAEKSERIEQITSVIEDIAFQTNLLALNASVEAARAGEHGKGFAIVAEAVRSLAIKSSQSAKEISTLIQGTVSVASAGRQAADESGLVLNRIVEAISKSSQINYAISAASKEQATGVREISETMSNIDQITQKNAALATDVKNSSDSLSSESASLRDCSAQLNLILKGA